MRGSTTSQNHGSARLWRLPQRFVLKPRAACLLPGAFALLLRPGPGKDLKTAPLLLPYHYDTAADALLRPRLCWSGLSEHFDDVIVSPLRRAFSHGIPTAEALDALAELSPILARSAPSTHGCHPGVAPNSRHLLSKKGSFARRSRPRCLASMLNLHVVSRRTPRAPRARLSPTQEVGAGSGYWAVLLRRRGVDVVATDWCPPDERTLANKFHTRPFVGADVQAADGAEAATKHPDRALFFCWSWSPSTGTVRQNRSRRSDTGHVEEEITEPHTRAAILS